MRTLRIGPGFIAAPSAFPRAPARQVIGWCWIGKPGNYKLFAIASGFKPVKVEGLIGKLVTKTPIPGSAAFG